jgi:protoporphyrinogen oxidase
MTGTIPERHVVVIGGGPAGLTAAHELIQHGIQPLVLEKSDKVGGIARTENYRGYYFDMGGHRFFTKSEEVNNFWRNVLGDEFLRRPRLSRIYYNRKFFHYPLKPLNALAGLGLWQSIWVGMSYLRWQLFPHRQEDTFEQWVTNRFGYRLFSIFFKSYTEKVWGISTSELSAEWAAQRIKDLDLKTALISMFIKPNNTIKTLIDEFDYPLRGPGMLWEKVKDQIEDQNGQVWLNTTACGFNRLGSRIESVNVVRAGVSQVVTGTDFISSMPITEFILKLNPPPPAEVLEAARSLSYRDFLTVCLIVERDDLFADNWIYIHDPAVKVGRIQNFKNWSPAMIPDPSKTSLGLEYFCNEGDELWNSPDQDLIELGKREIEKIGLAKYAEVQDGVVFRVEKSYPVYDSNYRVHLDIIKEYVNSLENFQTIGRNGLHRYNNQDHAMLTGMLAVRNLVFNQQNDLWSVNADQEYHEEIRTEQKPDIGKIADHVLSRAFMRIDEVAFGLAIGLAAGLALAFLTFFFVTNEQLALGLYLVLLGNFLPGYEISLAGVFLGSLYGFGLGFITGWSLAVVRNAGVKTYLSILRRRAELKLLQEKGILLDTQSQSTSDSSDLFK